MGEYPKSLTPKWNVLFWCFACFPVKNKIVREKVRSGACQRQKKTIGVSALLNKKFAHLESFCT